jgi:tetratricopeptide (TPR) repeat protein
MATENALSAPPHLPEPPIITRPPLGQLWQVPLFVAGLLSIVVVWATRPLWYDAQAYQVQRDLARARLVLENPHAPANEVPGLLTDALNHIDRCPKRAGEAHFLLGKAYVRLAGPISNGHTIDLWQQARLHLEQAEKLGVPEADQTPLQYCLGKALFKTRGDVQRTISNLLLSVDQAADDRAEAYAMLTEAYASLGNRQAALEWNQKQLDLPTPDENLLAPVRLQRGELLLAPGSSNEAPETRRQARENAHKVLARIGPGAAPTIVGRARRLQARSYMDDEAWAEAAETWENILSDRRQAPADLPAILYALGCCYDNVHRPDDASRVWRQIIGYSGQEGQAASLRLADLYRLAGDHAAAVRLVEHALNQVARPDDYRNNLLDLKQARALIETDCQACLQTKKFAEAQKLAQLAAKLAPQHDAMVLLAEVMQAWARSERDQSRKEKVPEAARRGEENAQHHFREAGAAYEAAAEAAPNEERKLETLWLASEDYRQGKDLAHQANVLHSYLTQHPPAARLSEAWFRLGEAHHALGFGRAAAESYKSCIGCPGPYAFAARYQLALIQIEQDNRGEAEEMLRQNLELMRVETDREAHEKTIYAYASLLCLRHDYRAAAQRWEQALKEYPGNPDALTARYWLGECYKQLAEVEFRNAQSNDPATRSSHQDKYYEWLKKEADCYQTLADDLEAQRPARPLSETEALILRQSLFAVAACRFNLGNYDEAIRLYDNLARRFQNQVEGLYAVKDLFDIYMLRGDLVKAKATLERFRLLLDALDDSAFQGRPAGEARAAWENWLKNANKQLRELSPMDKE